jgi:hypothetical protein
VNPKRLKRIIRTEIGTLRREGVIDGCTFDRLLDLYPIDRWDFSSLGRWFLVFGSIACAGGAAILGKQIFEFTLEKLAIVLGILALSLFYAGWTLRTKGLKWTKRSVELLGGLSLIGLTFTLGVIYSSGSGNWPALLLIDLLILLPLAYVLRNVLLLILAAIVFFTWFGGVTGYVSGWGMYWFGMNYPLRFLLAGLLMMIMAFIHRSAEQDRLRAYDGFFKVWLSTGVFFSEMALWLMSLFGNFGRIFEQHLETAGELIFFNTLWVCFNGALLWLGSRFGLRMLRGYAITFLVIQAYTFYFWKIAKHLGPVFATFLAGAVTLALVAHFESRRRGARSQALPD